MPTYLSPGVYVEEIPPAARPISGVGTSIAGFIGVVANTVDMPPKPGKPNEKLTVAAASVPQLITSWEEFKSQFGDIQAGNKTLALAVYGFFNNGGTRSWVLRVAEETDLTTPAEELEKFEAIDEITLVAVPGAITNVQHTALINHCAKMQDRFAILDGVESAGPGEISTIRPVGRSKEASYAALYYPWIKVFDPVTQAAIVLPPSGHIAGMYSRSDGARGVFKAPANEVLLGALDTSKPISKAMQDGLNPESINAIRSFNGAVKVWGGRTMADDGAAEFRYISTRRLMNFLRESIDDGTQWVVFEPNSPALWQRISRTIDDFLLTQWQAGALFGETAKQAYFVKCDKDTNPPQLRELGQVVTEIGVAIVKPAEFVIFRIQQTTGS